MSKSTDRTLIAIDYGRRRIGIAKSDPTGVIATALTTLEVTSKRQAVEELAGLIEQYKPTALVIGYPLPASGDPGEACREVDAFVEKLKAVYGGPIHRVDEYGTSEEAADIIHDHGERIGKDKKRVDRLAAVIILQRFLDETSGR